VTGSRRTSLLLGLSGHLVRILSTLLGVIVVMFVLQAVIPADPAALLAGQSATPDQVAALRSQLGLDQPLPIQLIRYLGRLLTGNLGTSLYTSRPVLDDLLERLPATMELALTALAISIVAGVPLGVVAALKRNSALDHILRVVTVSGFAVASF